MVGSFVIRRFLQRCHCLTGRECMVQLRTAASPFKATEASLSENVHGKHTSTHMHTPPPTETQEKQISLYSNKVPETKENHISLCLLEQPETKETQISRLCSHLHTHIHSSLPCLTPLDNSSIRQCCRGWLLVRITRHC